jgi:hypothetical protein
MEIVTGHSLKNIFKNHWPEFYLKHGNNIRPDIILNVTKMLSCRTHALGYHSYICPCCGNTLNVPHTCKSRFCSSCGKKATDQWIRKNMVVLPNTTWQHITFTMPSELWDLFWLNRQLFNRVSSIAANIIKNTAKKRKALVGIYTAIHTFGRDLKRNVHIHLSVTGGGLNINDHSKWVKDIFFSSKAIMPQWRYHILTMFRLEFKAGNLILPKSLKHINNYCAFNSWLSLLFNKTWVVHFCKKTNNQKRNVDYLGKYLKRPPIGETRIKSYDGNSVSFEYLDHYTNSKTIKTLTVEQFIMRLITHIHNRGFRCIRYYGFLANRVRGSLLTVVHKLLNNPRFNALAKLTKIFWQQLIINTFGTDPLECKNCKQQMQLSSVTFVKNISLFDLHQHIIQLEI